jgi:hypothetical protein
MDISGTILELLARKRRLEQIIATLQELQGRDSHPGKRRKRKFMGAEEREEVSRRMTRYWASRRKQKQNTM